MSILIRIHTYKVLKRATVQERGQVTIPKELRERLGLKAGSVLEFREEDGLLIAAKVESTDPVDQIYGMAGTGRRTDEVMRTLRGES
jgi:AbrB family looped-hinge helix DNA binding protein